MLKCASLCILAAAEAGADEVATSAAAAATKRRPVHLYQIIRDGMRGFGGHHVHGHGRQAGSSAGAEWQKMWADDHCMHHACAALGTCSPEALLRASSQALAHMQALQEALGNLLGSEKAAQDAAHAAPAAAETCSGAKHAKHAGAEKDKGAASAAGTGAAASRATTRNNEHGDAAPSPHRALHVVGKLSMLLDKTEQACEELAALIRERDEALALGQALQEEEGPHQVVRGAGAGRGGRADQGRGRKMLAKALAAASSSLAAADADGAASASGGATLSESPQPKAAVHSRGAAGSSVSRKVAYQVWAFGTPELLDQLTRAAPDGKGAPAGEGEYGIRVHAHTRARAHTHTLK